MQKAKTFFPLESNMISNMNEALVVQKREQKWVGKKTTVLAVALGKNKLWNFSTTYRGYEFYSAAPNVSV